jgi:hypothetical protein
MRIDSEVNVEEISGDNSARRLEVLWAVDDLPVLTDTYVKRQARTFSDRRTCSSLYGPFTQHIHSESTVRVCTMGKLTSTIGIPIKLLNEAQVRSRASSAATGG